MDIVNSGHHTKSKSSKAKRNKRDGVMKVVYISSPMKVKTSASKFRALVQELTGRHSDVSRLMELNGDHDNHDDSQMVPDNVHNGWRADDYVSSVAPPRESPASSDSVLLDPFDHDQVFTSQMDQQLSELFTSSFFSDSSGVDVLCSYDSL